MEMLMILMEEYLVMTSFYELRYKFNLYKQNITRLNLFWSTRMSFILVMVFITFFLASITVVAEPYLAIKNNLQCRACHVNPNGGGLRNEFGKIYGQSMLPETANSFDSAKLAKLTQHLSIGADARFNGTWQKNEQVESSSNQSFEVSSAQFYLNFTIPDSGLSFYIDQQIAPGSAINREAYVMYQFLQEDYIKAGKVFLPYGLRIEDDSAFIRQATGMNFDNSDNGVVYGVNVGNTSFNLYVANGTSQLSNDDDRFLYGVRVEHFFSNFRLGTSIVLNDGDKQTQMFNLYAGTQWRDFTFLAEVDYLILEAANSINQDDISQVATLAEINYQWRKGWNFKMTAEYLDSDDKVSENEQTRFSLVGEYTPISNIQLRFGWRVKQDIPQKPVQNYDLIFLQSHFYF